MTVTAPAPNYAPAPYQTLEVGSTTGFHSYVVDATNRKIGVAWGPIDQKVWTAALFAASPDMLAALKAVVEGKPNARELAAAAIAKVEGPDE